MATRAGRAGVPLKLSVAELAAPDRSNGRVVLEGYVVRFAAHPTPLLYFALVAEVGCCGGDLPRDPLRRVEVFAASAIFDEAGPVCLEGDLHVLTDDPAGWRYQLRGARRVASAALAHLFTRRHALAVLAVGAAGCAMLPDASHDAHDAHDAPLERDAPSPVPAALLSRVTVDVHSHAGKINSQRYVRGEMPLLPVAAPMRAGGMAVICLAIVSDGPTHRLMSDGRIHPYRDPAPGELQRYAEEAFGRIAALCRRDGLAVVASAADLNRARSLGPAVIVSAEGADFLEGDGERLAVAYQRWSLRHLQLTHYRVNEIGDIQTEPAVHGGLTPFGADVVRRCNRLGIVVDVAHGTLALVKDAARVTEKPLVLSHTSLAAVPRAQSRLISPEHARVVAETGGMIGVWPPAVRFPDMAALAGGIAHMVDVVGVDHVGLGTDLEGLAGPSTFSSYADLPALYAALRARGFSDDEAARILGGNYVRVFGETDAGSVPG